MSIFPPAKASFYFLVPPSSVLNFHKVQLSLWNACSNADVVFSESFPLHYFYCIHGSMQVILHLVNCFWLEWGNFPLVDWQKEHIPFSIQFAVSLWRASHTSSKGYRISLKAGEIKPFSPSHKPRLSSDFQVERFLSKQEISWISSGPLINFLFLFLNVKCLS